MVQVLRTAVRSLRAVPAFTTAVILTIATGIGVCTAVFSVLHGIAFPNLPYQAPDRLVVLGATMNRQVRVATEWLTPQQIQLWRNVPARSFAGASAFLHHDAVVESRDGGTIRVRGAAVDDAFFRVLGVAPRLGRTIDSADARGEPVIVISDAFWRTQFGSDPDVLRRTIRLGAVVYSIIGVMPRDFVFPARSQYWTATTSSQPAPGAYLIARLADGVTFAAAASEISAQYETAWGADSVRFGGMGVALERFGERDRRIGAGTLLLIAAGVAMVFLIVLVNLSVLLVARASRRAADFAIRTALGATPLHAVRPFLIELLVLAATGALLGVVVTAAATRIARATVPEYADAATPWSDVRVLAFAAALTLCTTLLLALQPALRLRRYDVITGLRRGANAATASIGERRTRNLLVAAQITVALVLIAAAGIVAKSLANLRRLDVGYDVERLVVAVPEYDIDMWDDARQRQLGEMFLDRFTTRGDLESVAIWRFRTSAWPPPPQDALFAVEGNEARAIPPAFQLQSYYEVSSEFFSTLGVRILTGRDFLATDGPGTESVAIIMESAARVWFGDEPAVGRRVRIGPPGSEWLRIVGIVPDLPRISSFGRELITRRRSAYLPWLFRPIAQAGDTPPANWPRRRCLDCAQITMAARVSHGGADLHGISRAVAAELRALAPELAVQPAPFIEQQMNGYTASLLRRNRAALLAFAALALALALLGLHGIVADTVARRTREIGIRIALGARAGDIIRTVARESICVATAAAVVGVVVITAATTLTKQLFFAGGHSAMLVGTSAADLYVVAPAAAAIILVAALTAVAGARRAARLDPNVALRTD